MADTYIKILVHCVFCTKGRCPQIRHPQSLWTYLRGIARNHETDVLAVGGTKDHVHMLLALLSSKTVAQLMRDLKANSSRHLNEQIGGFAWQDRYAAISVSPSQVDVVRRYIENQEAHHQTRGFEEEYIALLDRTAVRYSREYVFG
jgi:REP-associated tyrosine transposase